MFRLLTSLVLVFATAVCVWAENGEPLEPTPEQLARFQKMQQLADGLQYRQGKITLPNGIATINVGEDYRFLDARDAQTVLTDIWGNPPDADTLGMILPKEGGPLASGSWAVVVTFDPRGYVKDSDAATMDYGKLLQQMQKDVRAGNAEREKQGYSSIELVNWATPPHYDAATHKIYWAKQLRFGDSDHDTLNYCIRALGRRGVLELNVVAHMEQLQTVESATPSILGMVEFEQGHRYADFNASTDKVAEYGLAALIAGTVLVKTGLLKGILLGALAMKKFILIGLIALGTGIKKFFAKFSPPKQRNLDV